MIRDTVAPKAQAIARKLSGGEKTLQNYKADFEKLTDIALSGRPESLGLWNEFHSEAPDEALRSNIRVFLARTMEATTLFAGGQSRICHIIPNGRQGSTKR